MLDGRCNLELSAPQPAASPAPCGSYWAVCQTHPQAERWARDNLQRQGYATFLPICWSLRPDRVTPSLKHRIQRPLFGNYLFVTVDQHWAPIQHTRGVLRLLMANGRPGIVASAAVDALRAAEALAATRTQDDAQWAPGAPCALGSGSLRGHQAVVLRIHHDTAHLSVMILGGLREVQAPVSWLMARE
jgi:transcription antitermination factor NusG